MAGPDDDRGWARDGARLGVVSVLLPNLLLGLPAYAMSFLFAYGFQDSVGIVDHASFLILITVFAVVTGLIGAALLGRRTPGLPEGPRRAFCIPMSIGLNLGVVGVGSIVSALNKDQGSVSADFSVLTDALVAIFLFTAATALVRAALSTLP